MSTKYQSNAVKSSKEELVTSGKKKTSMCYMYTITFLSTIGGFLFGYDTGIVSGAMLLIRKEFQISDLWHASIVSGTIGAALVFSLVGGWLSDRFGRKPAILVASVAFTIGSVIMGMAENKETLLGGRLVVGAGVGIASMNVPVYLAECASSEMRGVLVTTYQLLITFGLLIANVIAGCLADVENGWRFMLGLAGVPAFIQFIGFLFMPESPRWLARERRYNDAVKVLEKLRGGAGRMSAEQECDALCAACDNADQYKQDQLLIGGTKSPLLHILRTPKLRRALLVGCLIHAIQQLCGINTVMYYSASIIRMAGFRDAALAIWMSALVAGVNFTFSLIGIFLVRNFGRRTLTIASLIGVIMSLLALGLGFELMQMESPAVTQVYQNNTCSYSKTCDECVDAAATCGFCFFKNPDGNIYESSCWKVDLSSSAELPLEGPCSDYPSSSLPDWAVGWCPTRFSWLPIIAMSMYLISFAPGLGPMPWIICSEIYPLWNRALCTSITTSVNWAMNLVVSLSFLSLLQLLTKHGTFYLYAVVAFLGLIIVWSVLPETYRMSLEQSDHLFENPWFCKGGPPGSCLGGNNVQYVHIRGLNRASPRSSTRPGEADAYNSEDSDS